MTRHFQDFAPNSNMKALQAFNLATNTAIATLNLSLQAIPSFAHMSSSDISSIRAQVRDITLLIPQLYKYRASLMRNLNFRESSISKLPPETLGEIFQHVCNPDSPGSWPPTKIGAICSHWRQVAWSTPQLWTDLIIGSRFWKSPQRINILDLYYKNMGALLLDIIIAKSPDDARKGPNGIPAEEVFDHIFIHNPHKLNMLMFEELPSSWLPHLERITKSTSLGLTNLTSLALSDRWDHPFPNLSFLFRKNNAIVIHNAPRLQKLALEGIAAPLFFPWAQITDLMLCDIDSERALQVVLQCTNLKVLKCENLAKRSDSLPLPDEEVMLRHLETFEYSGSYLSPTWEMALARCLRFTAALKQLTWLIEPGISGIRKEFLLHLPTSIVDIRLACGKDHNIVHDLEDILARLTSLRYLMLRLDDPLNVDVIDLLTVGEGDGRFLSSLRALGFLMPSEKLTDAELWCILEMARSRWEARENTETFEGFTFGFPLFDRGAIEWPEEFVDGMQELVREGLQVSIVGKEGKRLDDWLDQV